MDWRPAHTSNSLTRLQYWPLFHGVSLSLEPSRREVFSSCPVAPKPLKSGTTVQVEVSWIFSLAVPDFFFLVVGSNYQHATPS